MLTGIKYWTFILFQLVEYFLFECKLTWCAKISKAEIKILNYINIKMTKAQQNYSNFNKT